MGCLRGGVLAIQGNRSAFAALKVDESVTCDLTSESASVDGNLQVDIAVVVHGEGDSFAAARDTDGLVATCDAQTGQSALVAQHKATERGQRESRRSLALQPCLAN